MKMKYKIFNIIIVAMLLGFTNKAFAQQTARERLEQSQSATNSNSKAVAMSSRAIQSNRSQPIDIENTKWSRVIYRYLDLSKEKNAPLYYPVLPDAGRVNLFTMIFKLFANDKIDAYEYLDGREAFTDEYKINFMEFVDRFGIYYETQDGHMSINDVDIPSNEVQGYFVKEAHYFDSRASDFKTEVVAICPVIHRQGDYDAATTRYPLFWIQYSDILPYALSMPMMSSSLNNSMTGTVDDFFRKQSYDGEIYKAANPRNLAIAQYAESPEEVEMEQQKIEKQLVDFKLGLWRDYTDSTKVNVDRKKRRTSRKAAKVSTSSNAPKSGSSMRDRRY